MLRVRQRQARHADVAPDHREGPPRQRLLLRRVGEEKKKDVPKTLESVAKLVNAGKIALEHTEYELGGEFDEALEHAKARAKDVKVILTVDDVGATYE